MITGILFLAFIIISIKYIKLINDHQELQIDFKETKRNFKEYQQESLQTITDLIK